MTKTPSIFISYNPKARNEETLAVRLQTIGAVNGFRTLLPDRFVGKAYVDDETTRRIQSSDYFVIFATQDLSKVVLQEIHIAFEHFKDSSKIIVIYDAHEAPNFILENPGSVTLVEFDPMSETVDVVIKKVIEEIAKKEKGQQVKNSNNGLLALLGIGLGLVALASLVSSEED
jgi:hypothetical protein